MLEKEYKYYKDNQDKFLNLYRNKFIVIKNDEVIASYDDLGTAYNETIKEHELGTFMIHQCLPREEEVHSLGTNIIFA